jgi:hypothetical protein
MHKTPFGQVRGPRRLRRAKTDSFLAVPRVAPDWELAALKALMKPQLRGAIEHRRAEQEIPEDARHQIEAYCGSFNHALHVDINPHFPRTGDHWMLINLAGVSRELSRTLAVGISKQLPGVWFVLDRLFILDGRFYRRIQGYKLQLGPASDVHLPRELRAMLRKIS